MGWNKSQAATVVEKTQVEHSVLAELNKDSWVSEEVKVIRVFCVEDHRREGYPERTPEICTKVTLESLLS